MTGQSLGRKDDHAESEQTSVPDMDVEAYYFGCWQEVGHMFWTPAMQSASYKSGPPTPWGWKIDSDEFDSPDWHLEKLDGWTAIGIADRSVDTRPNSKSVFVFHADLTYADALSLARQTFPRVFARPRFPGAEGTTNR